MDPANFNDSLEERVTREHRRLESLFEATRVALSQEDIPRTLASIAELRNALEVHTKHEDQLYYPALWSLCPQHKDAFETFIRAHEGFRSDLDDIVRRITGSDLQGATRHFEIFARSFATHEVYEEDLLRRIDSESPWAASPNE